MTRTDAMGVGLIGCGDISEAYLTTLQDCPDLMVVACGDLEPERARARAEEFGIGRACATAELLASPDVDVVLNLTVPGAHAEIARAAIDAGKHVYGEKPLAVRRADGIELLDRALNAGVTLGCGPDTFLGAGIQTCRSLIDRGAIGEPVDAAASFLWPGHESWHPSPAFYYQRGGGPMLDMGPYYLTALVCLFGPAARVTGMTSRAHDQRTITSQPLVGQVIDVEVATHVIGTVEFRNGAMASIITSFDVGATATPTFEIYGTEATLGGLDPTDFDGLVLLAPKSMYPAPRNVWTEQPLISRRQGLQRGIGLIDFVDAVHTGRPPRASGELALHVLDICRPSTSPLRATHTSSSRQPVPLPSPCPPFRRSTLRSKATSCRAGASERFGLWERHTATVALWDEPVRDLRPLATAERERLLELLAGLSADEWLAPTSASGWAVRDIALHLLDDDLTWVSTQRDGELGALVDMSDRRTFPQLLAEKNQRWVEVARGMSRQVVAGLLRWSGEQVDSFHASQDLLREGWVSWASDEPVPYWFNVAQEFTERWVHQQQMREAVGRVDDHEATLPEVLRTFVWAFPHQLPHDVGARIIEIVIDDVGVWTLTPAGAAGWSLVAEPATRPDARLDMSADAAWRLLTGGTRPTNRHNHLRGPGRLRRADRRALDHCVGGAIRHFARCVSVGRAWTGRQGRQRSASPAQPRSVQPIRPALSAPYVSFPS